MSNLWPAHPRSIGGRTTFGPCRFRRNWSRSCGHTSLRTASTRTEGCSSASGAARFRSSPTTASGGPRGRPRSCQRCWRRRWRKPLLAQARLRVDLAQRRRAGNPRSRVGRALGRRPVERLREVPARARSGRAAADRAGTTWRVTARAGRHCHSVTQHALTCQNTSDGRSDTGCDSSWKVPKNG